MKIDEIIGRIKQPKNSALLSEAAEKQERTNYWTKEVFDYKSASTYQDTFLKAQKNIYNDSEAYNNFLQNLTYPLQTQGLSNKLKEEFHKVFDGINPFISFSINKKEVTDTINLTYFSDTVFNHWWEYPNDLIAVDKSDEKGVYKYFLDITSVYDVDEDEAGVIYCIFTKPEIIDGETALVYYSYDRDDLYKIVKAGDEFIVIDHKKNKLGITPIQFISNKGYIVKKHPLDSILGKYEELLRLNVNKSLQETYLAPFIKKYDTFDCDFRQGSTYCVGGYLATKDSEGTTSYITDGKNARRCPKCNTKTSAGKDIKVPAPETKEEADLIKDAISFVIPDPKFMEYTDERIAKKELGMFSEVMGSYSLLNPNQQQNETRVLENSDSKQKVINNWKTIFEEVIRKTNILHQGFKTGSVITGNVNLGTEFFFKTFEDLLAEKDTANTSGVSYIDYDTQLIETKYKTNPQEKARLLLIKKIAENLRPYNEYSKEQVFELYTTKEDFTKEDFLLYSNFFALIKRFEESNNTSIVDLFEGSNFDTALKGFESKIKQYLNIKL